MEHAAPAWAPFLPADLTPATVTDGRHRCGLAEGDSAAVRAQ